VQEAGSHQGERNRKQRGGSGESIEPRTGLPFGHANVSPLKATADHAEAAGVDERSDARAQAADDDQVEGTLRKGKGPGIARDKIRDDACALEPLPCLDQECRLDVEAGELRGLQEPSQRGVTPRPQPISSTLVNGRYS
jgi:hypothetical protein